MEPTWDDVVALASKYDCMALGGGMQRAAAVADAVRMGWWRTGGCDGAPAQDLQICLSFECRTLSHCGMTPQGDDFRFLASIYETLRTLDS